MILICGGLADLVTEFVCARIENLGYEYRLLNLGLYPARYRVSCTWDEGELYGSIACDDWELDLADVSGIFVRYVDQKCHVGFPLLPTAMQLPALGECQAGIMAVLECFPGLAVNRMRGSMSNQSKPYQALFIREAGFRIPRTLITSDSEAARRFIKECGGNVIFKSLSGIRSIVRRVEKNDFQRLRFLQDCPVQFQEFTAGDNFRIHVVGDKILSTQARTEAVDYRYAEQQGFSLEMQAITLPREIERACLTLTQRAGLVFSGIDLKQTPDGEYYCLEVNPAPGFVFYERHTGQPISTALVELLRRGDAGVMVPGADFSRRQTTTKHS